jgi:hypothetical protein
MKFFPRKANSCLHLRAGIPLHGEMDDDELPEALPISLSALARVYRVAPPSLRAASIKLQLRMEFMANPYAIRSWMVEDGCSRGKLRRTVFDEAECQRIATEVHNLRYPDHARETN